MSDVFTKEKRSEIMSRIRSKGNKQTELRMIELLKRHKITGWRRHLPLRGKPDFAFPRTKVVVFVDGCFWHGCPRCYIPPRTNSKYWSEKIDGNRKRDKQIIRRLRGLGWKVIRVWEHEIARTDSLPARLRKATE